MTRLRSGERIVEHENHWVTKTGEKRYIRWRNSVLLNGRGDVEFLVGTGIDISDRKRLEEELDRRAQELIATNRDLEAFAYSVSHDLRTPLAAIAGLSDILLEDYGQSLDGEAQDYLRRISGSVGKLQHLIDDMLSLSRAGRQEMAIEEVGLSAMVAAIFEDLRRSEPNRGVETDIASNIHAQADPRLLHVAIENLLRNAWKFTSQKNPARIEFGTLTYDEKTVYYIRDNGAGFDPEKAREIFEPFKRGHGERDFAGSGIGLSIVKRVIARHGGRVWAEGNPGQGATFFFTLERDRRSTQS